MSDWYSEGHAIQSIAADDRAGLYGDGLFETIAIRSNAPRLWGAHVARLQSGCARLALECPPTAVMRAELENAIAQSAVPTDFATAKLLVSAGTGARGYQRSAGAKSILRVGLFAAHALSTECYRDGVDVRLCATRLAIQPQLAGIKSLNRLEQVLARSEWHDNKIFEGLLHDAGGRLICGTMSNVFIAKQSALVTPAITRCGVSGIMRAHVLGLLQQAGIDCETRDVAAAELWSADEVFLTNSQFGIMPVRRCTIGALAADGSTTSRWQPGALTRRAQLLAAENGIPECRP
jgi:4-amino-4-deoxychorismate lyase